MMKITLKDLMYMALIVQDRGEVNSSGVPQRLLLARPVLADSRAHAVLEHTPDIGE